ncbi:hypothetical protein [Xenorhabdus sp. PB30.3]|uniref:hypothetical protein n=1 Tax=Xenorhabdus sp. PB30.3 TaxID=2788941 RepID=UPI001E3E691D|nr:hypothetical protein [Xenorhabdus sp. PB30.3]MCC8381370.1 hypothetical protein [Xenorhabdus sp. PB30.3]
MEDLLEFFAALLECIYHIIKGIFTFLRWVMENIFNFFMVIGVLFCIVIAGSIVKFIFYSSLLVLVLLVCKYRKKIKSYLNKEDRF